MPNKNTFLQNAIKDIDNNKPIWFTDSYTNPNPSLTGKIIFHKFSGCFV